MLCKSSMWISPKPLKIFKRKPSYWIKNYLSALEYYSICIFFAGSSSFIFGSVIVRTPFSIFAVLPSSLTHSTGPPGDARTISLSEADPLVVIRWDVSDRDLILTIEDNGPGLLNPSNAFVPFYTTKPAGSGIGLVLSRQITEAHGGSIELVNRADKRGCRARVTLPRARVVSALNQALTSPSLSD